MRQNGQMRNQAAEEETSSPRLAIVAAAFHPSLIDDLIAAATAEAQRQKARIVRVITVPGSFELPLVVDRLLARRTVDAIIALGFIERGETQHGEVMGHVVCGALVALQLQYRTPIGIGIIGPGATKAQAEARKERTARGAVTAALASVKLLQSL